MSDGQALFAMMFLSPIVLLIGVPVYLIGKAIRVVPAGVPDEISFLIVVTSAFGILCTLTTYDGFVRRPAMFQREYLGAEYGTVWTLRFAEKSGFMDPTEIWTYKLSAQDAARLRRRCRMTPSTEGVPTCSLHSSWEEDPDWYSSLTLEGNELRMEVGGH